MTLSVQSMKMEVSKNVETKELSYNAHGLNDCMTATRIIGK